MTKENSRESNHFDLKETEIVFSLTTVIPHGVKQLQICESPKQFLIFDDKSMFKQAAELYHKTLRRTKNVHNAALQTVIEMVENTIGTTNRTDNMQRFYLYAMNNNRCPISAFYGKDISECSERAIMSHNLFLSLGVKSFLVSGPMSLNNETTFHQYNIIQLKDNYFMFDLACCSTQKVHEKIVKLPLIKQLTKQEVSSYQLENPNAHHVLLKNIEPVQLNMSSGKQYCMRHGHTEPSM